MFKPITSLNVNLVMIILHQVHNVHSFSKKRVALEKQVKPREQKHKHFLVIIRFQANAYNYLKAFGKKIVFTLGLTTQKKYL